jgi:hypothetical protein
MSSAVYRPITGQQPKRAAVLPATPAPPDSPSKGPALAWFQQADPFKYPAIRYGYAVFIPAVPGSSPSSGPVLARYQPALSVQFPSIELGPAVFAAPVVQSVVPPQSLPRAALMQDPLIIIDQSVSVIEQDGGATVPDFVYPATLPRVARDDRARYDVKTQTLATLLYVPPVPDNPPGPLQVARLPRVTEDRTSMQWYGLADIFTQGIAAVPDAPTARQMVQLPARAEERPSRLSSTTVPVLDVAFTFTTRTLPTQQRSDSQVRVDGASLAAVLYNPSAIGPTTADGRLIVIGSRVTSVKFGGPVGIKVH